jgi:hypothetical protein
MDLKLPRWIFDGHVVRDEFAVVCVLLGVALIILPFVLAALLEER